MESRRTAELPDRDHARHLQRGRSTEAGGYLVDKILDVAGAKGTGKWMSQLALDLGVPSTLVTEAVYARCLSALKEARVRASKVLNGPAGARFDVGGRKEFIEQVRQALYASKICSYAQALCNCRRPRRSTNGR